MTTTLEVLATAQMPRRVFSRATLITSDRHENGAGPQDNFQRELFLRLCRLCPPGLVNHYSAGDNRDRYEAPLRAIRAHNRAVERVLAEYFGEEVAGNHDLPTPGALLEIETEHLFLWHGHQLDPACRGRGTLGRVAGALWGLAERLYLGRALDPLRARALRWNARRIGGTAAERRDDNAVWKADAERRRKALYVNGHSHRPELCVLAHGGVYLNPGSCVEPGSITFALVIEREVRLYRMSETDSRTSGSRNRSRPGAERPRMERR